jgi:nitrous oxidase accessory protein NosD
VSTKGSDGAKGTREAPLRTIGKAAVLANPGDVIRVLPGVYPEEILLESRGSGVAPITLRGEGSPRPTLAPGGRVRSSVIRVRGRWNLENLQVDVGGAPMFAVIFESAAIQSVLSGSELKSGTTGAGVLVAGARDITIQGNSIHHFIKPGDDSHGVVVVGPSRNITVRGNDIHHNSGDSVQCQAGTAPAEGLLIEGNTLHDEGENGVDIKQCYRITVRDNVLFGFPNSAIRPSGSSAGEGVLIQPLARDILVQGNSIARAGRGVSVLGGNWPPENVAVLNNHIQEIRNIPAGNGQGIRIEGARNARVEGNLIEGTASYGLMLAADGKVITGLVVRNNTVRAGSQRLVLRLGDVPFRPGIVMQENLYSFDGIMKADFVTDSLSGDLSRFLDDFPGDRLTLSSEEKLEVWRQVIGVEQGSGLLE